MARGVQGKREPGANEKWVCCWVGSSGETGDGEKECRARWGWVQGGAGAHACFSPGLVPIKNRLISVNEDLRRLLLGFQGFGICVGLAVMYAGAFPMQKVPAWLVLVLGVPPTVLRGRDAQREIPELLPRCHPGDKEGIPSWVSCTSLPCQTLARLSA